MNPSIEPGTERTWRSIPQQVKAKSMTPRGRRRAAWGGLRMGAAAALVAGFAWIGVEVVRLWPRVSEPVAVFKVRNDDGILGEDWVRRTLSVPVRTGLGELDLYVLQERLLRHPQVRTANLRRDYPETLVVELTERTPVARIRTEEGDLMVARDGVVFPAGEYAARRPGLVLPWLDGIRLVRDGRGFKPVDGMAILADLLQAAQQNAPHLYRDWQAVNLARLETDREIEVRMPTIDRVVFGTEVPFRIQLGHLNYIAEVTPAALATVNLGLGSDRAIVTPRETLLGKSSSRPVLIPNIP